MMTHERIAELRKRAESCRNKGEMTEAATIDELLDAAETCRQIADLLQAGMMSSHRFLSGGDFEVAFESIEEARELHDLLEALTPTPQREAR